MKSSAVTFLEVTAADLPTLPEVLVLGFLELGPASPGGSLFLLFLVASDIVGSLHALPEARMSLKYCWPPPGGSCARAGRR
eukprot:768373-Hanusia_phi.AAC.5